jgi:hypothetical protein
MTSNPLFLYSERDKGLSNISDRVTINRINSDSNDVESKGNITHTSIDSKKSEDSTMMPLIEHLNKSRWIVPFFRFSGCFWEITEMKENKVLFSFQTIWNYIIIFAVILQGLYCFSVMTLKFMYICGLSIVDDYDNRSISDQLDVLFYYFTLLVQIISLFPALYVIKKRSRFVDTIDNFASISYCDKEAFRICMFFYFLSIASIIISFATFISTSNRDFGISGLDPVAFITTFI